MAKGASEEAEFDGVVGVEDQDCFPVDFTRGGEEGCIEAVLSGLVSMPV